MEQGRNILSYFKKEAPVQYKDSYIFFLTDHGAEGDFDGLRDLVAKPDVDIYVPENPGWPKETLEYLRAVSSGKFSQEQALSEMSKQGINPDSLEYSAAFKKQFDVIQDTQKPVVFAEDDMKLNLKTLRMILSMARIKPLEVKPDETFEETADAVINYLRGIGNFIRLRQDNLLSQVDSTNLRRLLSDYPEFQNKESIRAAFCYGAGHIRVPLELKKQEKQATTVMSNDLFAYGYQTQGMQRAIYGYEIGRELVSRVLLEKLFTDTFESGLLRTASGSQEVVRCTREVVSSFDPEEIKVIVEAKKKNSNFEALFRTRVEEKGFRL